MTAKRPLALFAAALAFLPCAYAASQAQMARSCEVEIDRVEARIVEARKKPEYRSEHGRKALSTADRWLYQARQHAAKGESRHCLEAAKKGRAQL
jgi:Zn-dependent protease with chaperone function